MGYVEDDEIFYVHFLSKMSHSGGWFEKGTMWGFIPSIALTVVMSQISAIYETTAEKATELENHRTKEDH